MSALVGREVLVRTRAESTYLIRYQTSRLTSSVCSLQSRVQSAVMQPHGNNNERTRIIFLCCPSTYRGLFLLVFLTVVSYGCTVSCFLFPVSYLWFLFLVSMISHPSATNTSHQSSQYLLHLSAVQPSTQPTRLPTIKQPTTSSIANAIHCNLLQSTANLLHHRSQCRSRMRFTQQGL